MGNSRKETIKYNHLNLLCGIDLLDADYHSQHFSKHTHDGYAFGVITQGELDFSYLSKSWEAQPGDINLVVPGEAHDGHGKDHKGWSYKMLYLPPEILYKVYADRTGKDTLPWFTAGVVQDSLLSKNLLHLYQQLTFNGEAALEQESSLIEWLTAFVERYSAEPIKMYRGGKEHQAIKICLDFIQEHFQEPISLSALSQLTNLSPYYLLRSFKKATGLPPHLYQQLLRIKIATELLLSGDSPVNVAADLGYTDQSHFSRQFKQITGVTPGNFANNR
jgi:AraC-like DNA-binding protein